MKSKGLSRHIKNLLSQVDQINADRQKLLRLIADLIIAEIRKNRLININFICTHNSRRSQLAEAWLVAACQHFNISNIHAYSGGVEATAFNIRMVVALRHFTFHLHTDGPRSNPLYVLQALGPTKPPHIMFSKVFDHPSNPRQNVMALMVCDDADQNCPIVPGVSHRISLTYKDPKEFDDTPMENDAYIEKVEEIGREILYLIQQVHQQLKS